MIFHSLQFLLFLPVVLGLYWSVAAHETARRVLLVVASLVFYMAWNPAPVVLLLALTTIDWLVARGLQDAPGGATTKRRVLLGVSLTSNLGSLAMFKYADWLMRVVGDACAALGVHVVWTPLHWLLPVGLSFIVFQGLSYTIDVYRGDLVARRSWLDVAAFMTFFPHLVAGPIVRARDFLPQLEEAPRLDDAIGQRALLRIAWGMTKKLAVADYLAANLVDRVFADPGNYAGLDVTAAVFAYTVQIYADFSAYSDIALGTAALFGITLKENFDRPYLSSNLFEFWRRWHISLGSWLRDYLYIPLGGNRRGRARTLVNLLVTMVLGGIWHGADGRYALWGLVHGLGMCATQMWWWSFGRSESPGFVRRWMSVGLTFFLVMELRIVFRAADLSHAWTVFVAQLPHGGHATHVSSTVLAVLLASVVLHGLPPRVMARAGSAFSALPVVVRAAMLLGCAIGLSQVAGLQAQPFIYGHF